jgi:hypothetical protein
MASDDAFDRSPWRPPPDEDSGARPFWNQDEAGRLIGKYILVGITRYAADGKTVKSLAQYHGRIVGADEKHGLKIECEGVWSGKTMGLPPDLRPIKPARSGEYRLKSTGEVIADPDIVATWSIVEPPKS